MGLRVYIYMDPEYIKHFLLAERGYDGYGYSEYDWRGVYIFLMGTSFSCEEFYRAHLLKSF